MQIKRLFLAVALLAGVCHAQGTTRTGQVVANPGSNGVDIYSATRATDSTPTGNFVNYKSLAGVTLFKIDINGNITANGFASLSFFSVPGITSTKVSRDCRQDGVVGDGVTDDSTAINNCIANAVTANESVIQLPAGNFKVNTSINLTNRSSVTFQGVGSNVPAALGIIGVVDTNTNVTSIFCNTGTSPCLDRTGSSYGSLKQMNLVAKNSFSAPSNVIELLGRDNGGAGGGATNPFCYAQFNSDDHIYITTDHSTTFNGGRGYLGIYDVGAELYTLTNSAIITDLPVWLDTANTLSVSSSYQTLQTGCSASMEGFTTINTAYTTQASGAAAPVAIVISGTPTGLHTFISGLCQTPIAGAYCIVVGSNGTYGMTVLPAFTDEQATNSAGAGGFLFSNGNISDSHLDVSTAIPSGSFNGWFQFAGTGITVTDSTFKVHKINNADTAEPLINNAVGLVLKGGELQLGSTSSPLSATNVTLTGSRVVGAGFTSGNISFNSSSTYLQESDSGLAAIGGFTLNTFAQTASTNPAGVGIFRCSASDACVQARNQANSGDINLVQHKSDDTVQVGGSAGVSMTGLMKLYDNIATADFGLSPIVGTPIHVTGQTANLGATNLFAAPTTGMYKVVAQCRTTTSGTGTTATFTINWADEGGAKSLPSATWALNSVTSSGATSFNFPLHINSGTAVTFSTTGTFGTSVYACDAWLEREN